MKKGAQTRHNDTYLVNPNIKKCFFFKKVVIENF